MDLSQGWDEHYIVFNHILMASVKIPLWRLQPIYHESMYNQFDYQLKICIQKGSHTKASLTPQLCFYWIACCKARKWAIMYCVVWYRFSLFLRFVFYNYTDSVVFFVFHFIIIWSYWNRTKCLKTYDDISVQSDTFPNGCLNNWLRVPNVVNVSGLSILNKR